MYFETCPENLSRYFIYKTFILNIFITNRNHQSYENDQMYDSAEFQVIPAGQLSRIFTSFF